MTLNLVYNWINPGPDPLNVCRIVLKLLEIFIIIVSVDKDVSEYNCVSSMYVCLLF